MRTCEIRVKVRKHFRWIRAYQDAGRGPLCIDCAVQLHPKIRLDRLGDQDDAYSPVYEDDREGMSDVYEATCCGKKPRHSVLCSARTERRGAQSAQRSLDFGRHRS